ADRAGQTMKRRRSEAPDAQIKAFIVKSRLRSEMLAHELQSVFAGLPVGTRTTLQAATVIAVVDAWNNERWEEGEGTMLMRPGAVKKPWTAGYCAEPRANEIPAELLTPPETE